MMPKNIRFFCLAFFLLFFIASCQKKVSKNNSVCFSDTCYEVELALTQEQRTQGLQFRTSLEPGKGMLFIFPERRAYAFWMKDTYIPLDIIWLDHNRRIVHIEENVPPCQSSPCPVYPPAQKALYVLEVNAGQSSQNQLEEGLTAEFHITDISPESQ